METPWGGEMGTVAVARQEPWRRWRSDAEGKERARWIWRGVGEAQEPRREWGRVGGGIEEAGHGGLILEIGRAHV